MRGQWGDGAQQLLVTELRDKGREVERREVEAALEEKHSSCCGAAQGDVSCTFGGLQNQPG